MSVVFQRERPGAMLRRSLGEGLKTHGHPSRCRRWVYASARALDLRRGRTERTAAVKHDVVRMELSGMVTEEILQENRIIWPENAKKRKKKSTIDTSMKSRTS